MRRRNGWRLTAVVIAALFASQAGARADALTPTLGTFSLREDGRALEVFGETDARPTMIIVPLPQPTRDLLRVGDYAFLINRDAGVTRVDLRDVRVPKLRILEPMQAVTALVRSGERTVALRLASGEYVIHDVIEPHGTIASPLPSPTPLLPPVFSATLHPRAEPPLRLAAAT
jgi:hypothetical protein